MIIARETFRLFCIFQEKIVKEKVIYCEKMMHRYSSIN